MSGDGKLVRGSGPVRTGVTAILPRGKSDTVPVFEGYFSQTGTAWIEESGFAEGPVLLTNTHSVGLARDALVKWELEQADRSSKAPALWSLQIVAETWDGYLSDINGFHVKEQDVFHALDTARGGGVEEGSVGGGTGMVSMDSKAGSERPPESWMPQSAVSRWAFLCSAIAEGVRCSESRERRWVRRSRKIFPTRAMHLVQVTEEAIVNAMVDAKTMTGIDGRMVTGLPHDELVKVLRKYNRLSK